MKLRPAFPAAAVLLTAACGPNVAIRHGFDFQTIHRVAVMSFHPAGGHPESGQVAADPFAQELLKARYDVIERQQVDAVMKEHRFAATGAVDPKTVKELGRILGVDALVVGDVTDYVPGKTVIVPMDVEEDESEPIMGTRARQVEQNGEMVTIHEQYVKAYRTRRTRRRVPQKQLVDATVGASVRLVAVETGQVLWSASASEDGLNVADAAGEVAHDIVRAVKKTWPLVPKD